jgi:transcriptional regulator with XRE-family HTH domain
MLSRVERGESSPTAQLLNKICGGLGVTLSALFAATEQAPAPLSRREKQSVWRDPASGYLRRSVSPLGSPVDLVEVEFPPGGSVGFENSRAGGMAQLVWLIEGSLEITLGDEVFRLEAGDCLFMRLDRPIRFRNPADMPVRYLVVLSHGGSSP